MSKLSIYLSETKDEIKQISWPTRKQTFLFTSLVVFISIIVAAYLGFFDWLFSIGLKSLIY